MHHWRWWVLKCNAFVFSVLGIIHSLQTICSYNSVKIAPSICNRITCHLLTDSYEISYWGFYEKQVSRCTVGYNGINITYLRFAWRPICCMLLWMHLLRTQACSYLSLSLSLTHTHTHTHNLLECVHTALERDLFDSFEVVYGYTHRSCFTLACFTPFCFKAPCALLFSPF